MKAIIGGTGIDEVTNLNNIKEIETQYGKVSYVKDGDLIIVLRHGKNHQLPPHEINYRANIEALSLLNVKECICIYSVGSISSLLPPGEATLMSDFIDFTYQREKTFSTENNVFHARMVDIFDRDIENRIKSVAKTEKFEIKKGGVYVCTEGPRLETAAEIKMFGIWKADFVGMTACPEIPLLVEKNIKVASLCYSINWACGIDFESKVSFIEDEEISIISDKLTKICKKALFIK